MDKRSETIPLKPKITNSSSSENENIPPENETEKAEKEARDFWLDIPGSVGNLVPNPLRNCRLFSDKHPKALMHKYTMRQKRRKPKIRRMRAEGGIYFFKTNKIMSPQDYWKANLKLLAVLLFIWFVISFGFGIVLSDFLDQFSLGGFKLGFWFAQQGSIYGFVVLIFIYVFAMRRLEKKINKKEEENE